VPLRRGATLDHALADGEDYELCFTAAGDVPETLGDVPVTRIGRITGLSAAATPALSLIDTDGRRRNLDPAGWEHGSRKTDP